MNPRLDGMMGAPAECRNSRGNTSFGPGRGKKTNSVGHVSSRWRRVVRAGMSREAEQSSSSADKV